MADDNGSDRNLPASQRKLEKAREEGQVARSRDLGHFAAIAAGGAVLVVLAPKLTAWLQQLLADASAVAGTSIRTTTPAVTGSPISRKATPAPTPASFRQLPYDFVVNIPFSRNDVPTTTASRAFRLSRHRQI